MTEKQYQYTRFAKVASYEAFKILEEATLKQRTIRYEIPMSKFFTAKRPSRLLTQCIQKYAKGVGAVCNENVRGGLIKERGEFKYVYSGGKVGQADLSIYYQGRVLEIEIKIKDKQSDAQKKYQQQMEKAGVPYFICHTFDEFLENFDDFLKLIG